MMTRAEKNALYEREAAALYNSMPKRVDGIWCDSCGRKLPPADMLSQYYDAENRRFRGECRTCSRKRELERKSLYSDSSLLDDARSISVPCVVTFEFLSKYWTDEDFLYLEYVPRYLQGIVIDRFGSLDNFNLFKAQKEPPKEAPDALPF